MCPQRIDRWEHDCNDRGRNGHRECPKPHFAIERPWKEAECCRPIPASGHDEAATRVLRKIPFPDIDVVILIWPDESPNKVLISNCGCAGGFLCRGRVRSISLLVHQPDHDQDATHDDACPNEQPADESFPPFRHRRLRWCRRERPCSQPRYYRTEKFPSPHATPHARDATNGVVSQFASKCPGWVIRVDFGMSAACPVWG